jgi:hypothetical protein
MSETLVSLGLARLESPKFGFGWGDSQCVQKPFSASEYLDSGDDKMHPLYSGTCRRFGHPFLADCPAQLAPWRRLFGN